MPETWCIRLRGQVQGVGFRPFIWKAATARRLCGQVSNGMSGVEVVFNGSREDAQDFHRFLLSNAPKGSRVTTHTLAAAPPQQFHQFSIRESTSDDAPLLLLSPDVAVCPDCLRDVHTPGNRRANYAFTTCTYCGPRFSILETLPYDRSNTTMRDFALCPDCTREYNDPADRRFFGQTNSCPVCGIQMRLLRPDGSEMAHDTDDVLEKTLEIWRAGGIVAIKGIGGYLLTCDATRALAVSTLRQRKKRPTKPFALMYPNVKSLGGDVLLGKKALNALQNPAAPIVLVPLKKRPASGIAGAEIAPALDQIGVMLPYAPLFVLLLEKWGRPIVATSGNTSGSPIVYQETDLHQLSDIADAFLTHNRHISMPQDDSVLAFANGPKPIVLRRSRGLAPALTKINGGRTRSATPDVVALGAEMKAAFSLRYHGNLLVSQYLGDLSDFDTQQRYETLVRRTLGQFSVQPVAVLADVHPAYFTTGLGQQLARELDVPFVQIQHHEAHFAAVLAENRLLTSKKAVLGVIWDGTGYGHDGQIWGGEFFSYRPENGIKRLGHFPSFPLILGDKMAREPRLSALAFCQSFAPEKTERLSGKFTPSEWHLYPKMHNARPLTTTSMGRVFDAVAALLGLADKVSYEGEAALLLETAARRFFRQNTTLQEGYFSKAHQHNAPFSPEWLAFLMEDLEQTASPERVAALFHLSLVEMVSAVAVRGGFETVAFSGGVFQNTLLVSLLRKHLKKIKIKPCFHQELSPNDENISFGQLTYHTAHLSSLLTHH
jgi:hydrogenase maturation protein HypF